MPSASSRYDMVVRNYISFLLSRFIWQLQVIPIQESNLAFTLLVLRTASSKFYMRSYTKRLISEERFATLA